MGEKANARTHANHNKINNSQVKKGATIVELNFPEQWGYECTVQPLQLEFDEHTMAHRLVEPSYITKYATLNIIARR